MQEIVAHVAQAATAQVIAPLVWRSPPGWPCAMLGLHEDQGSRQAHPRERWDTAA